MHMHTEQGELSSFLGSVDVLNVLSFKKYRSVGCVSLYVNRITLLMCTV